MIRSQIDYWHHHHHHDRHQGRPRSDPGARGLRDQGGGEVAQLTHLQPPALGLLGDQAGVPGVGPEEPGLGLLLQASGQLVDVITDHQTPKEKTIHSFKYVNDACLPVSNLFYNLLKPNRFYQSLPFHL